MKILIITPLFPPQNAVGALRPYTWAKYWARSGHNVDVFTVESYGTDSGLLTNLTNVTVTAYPVPFISKMAKKWQKVNVNITAANNTTDTPPSIQQCKKSLFSILKKSYRNFIDRTGCIMGVRYPDMRDFWAKKVKKNINPLKYDFVISTGCPYSVHKVGYYVKKKNPSAFWIVDWRDLWTKNPYWKGIGLFNGHEKRLERKFHKTADLITVVSDGLKEDLSTITNKKIITIPNGFDKEDYTALLEHGKKHFNKTSFIYTGTIYKGVQDITPFLHAMKELLDEKAILKEQVSLIAAGNVADLNEDIKELGLQDIYTFKGMLPRPQALELIYNCDAALMLLGKNNKGILTGKLFEYLSLADYIFGVDFANTSDAGKIIRQANAGECFDSNVAEIKKAILQRIEEKTKGLVSEKNNNIIEMYSREKLAQELISYVK